MGTHKLPGRLRKELSSPIGELFLDEEISAAKLYEHLEDAIAIVAVGDLTTETLLGLGVRLDVYVVDGREKRHVRTLPVGNYQTKYHVTNSSGTLSDESILAITSTRMAEKPVMIIVDGEEDLLVLPFVATYPDKSYILYGQPNEGIVSISVDGEKRMYARSILREMGINLD